MEQNNNTPSSASPVYVKKWNWSFIKRINDFLTRSIQNDFDEFDLKVFTYTFFHILLWLCMGTPFPFTLFVPRDMCLAYMCAWFVYINL